MGASSSLRFWSRRPRKQKGGERAVVPQQWFTEVLRTDAMALFPRLSLGPPCAFACRKFAGKLCGLEEGGRTISVGRLGGLGRPDGGCVCVIALPRREEGGPFDFALQRRRHRSHAHSLPPPASRRPAALCLRCGGGGGGIGGGGGDDSSDIPEAAWPASPSRMRRLSLSTSTPRAAMAAGGASGSGSGGAAGNPPPALEGAVWPPSFEEEGAGGGAAAGGGKGASGSGGGSGGGAGARGAAASEAESLPCFSGTARTWARTPSCTQGDPLPPYSFTPNTAWSPSSCPASPSRSARSKKASSVSPP